ncbi:MAG TPA: hypothetical protein VM243_09015 [Phycisphaerae bacterium]|nr:hypothetical protein [Phycisphaerae bacterium]
MADYIAGGDAEFNAWLDNFVTYASAKLAELGLAAGDLTPITTAQTTWAGALAAHVTAQQTARSATQQKNADRAAVLSLVRAEPPHGVKGHLKKARAVALDQAQPTSMACNTQPHKILRFPRSSGKSTEFAPSTAQTRRDSPQAAPS